MCVILYCFQLNSQGLWDTLLKDLGLPSPCVNGGVAIRQIYLRYLERWDRSKNASLGIQGGGDGDVINAEVDDERPRRGVWGTPKPRNTVAQSYNHTQHVVPGLYYLNLIIISFSTSAIIFVNFRTRPRKCRIGSSTKIRWLS